MSQYEIEQALCDAQDDLESLTEAYRDAIVAAAEAESHYKGVHARAFHRSPANAAAAKSKYADTVTESELQAHLVSEAIAKWFREALSTRRSEIDKLRTLNANLRPQVS
jgi:hypothetical protein